MVVLVFIAGREGKALTMPVRRDPRNGRWFFRAIVALPDGTKTRVFGTPGIVGPYHDLAQTKEGAQKAEQRAVQQLLNGPKPAEEPKKEVSTFHDWFTGAFWRQWVVGKKNKPSEVRSKEIIYRVHLQTAFGHLRLDEIGTSEVADFRAQLVEKVSPTGKKLSEKRINNILAVLSKPLKYAEDCEVIRKAPKIGMFKVERPEIEFWEFEQYARLLAAAKADDPRWYAAACLAGEAGLRVGEVKALRWREDVDMVAQTLTVNQQTRNGDTTSPKGRKRRTIPMTATLYAALKRMDVVREGFVVRNPDGKQLTDHQADAVIRRVCRLAGLPQRFFHTLRHTFGTHAAMFGVNPWVLQEWMGHKRLEETYRYVHVANAHRRPLPEEVLHAMQSEIEPTRQTLAMLGARGSVAAAAKEKAAETLRISAA